MGLFDTQFDQIDTHLESLQAAGNLTRVCHLESQAWPESSSRDLIMGMDTAVELGHPKAGSMAFLIWIDEPARIINRRMTLIGPELASITSRQHPFGKIVRLGVRDLTPDNFYAQYHRIENVRFDMRLQGYMLRGASQYGREWSRVSRVAIRDGFSFSVLGAALMDRYLALDFIDSVDIIFFTAGLEVMRPFMPLTDQVLKTIAAMNKMVADAVHDCDTCEYSDVCGEVAELQAMRRSIQVKGRTHNA